MLASRWPDGVNRYTPGLLSEMSLSVCAREQIRELGRAGGRVVREKGKMPLDARARQVTFPTKGQGCNDWGSIVGPHIWRWSSLLIWKGAPDLPVLSPDPMGCLRKIRHPIWTAAFPLSGSMTNALVKHIMIHTFIHTTPVWRPVLIRDPGAGRFGGLGTADDIEIKVVRRTARRGCKLRSKV